MMDTSEIKVEKKQNILAVFEHIPIKEKKPARVSHYRRSVLKPYAQPDSDNELSQEEDDSGPKRKRLKGVRLSQEPLQLKCSWRECSNVYTGYHEFMEHLFEHCEQASDNKDNAISIEIGFECKWKKCSTLMPSFYLFKQHIAYHGYLTRLINIGKNVLGRVSLPACLLESEFAFPVENEGYKCGWCTSSYCTIFEFYRHIHCHVSANPKYCKKGETILCDWNGCTQKFSSQYRLSDHSQTHTDENVIACPTCLTMFKSKSKFNDHRRRQLPVELCSYQCSQCSKLYPNEKFLRDHMRSHINIYKCTMCDMTCAKPSALKTHVQYRHLPESERLFKCGVCEKSCVTKPALEMHLLTHFPEQLFACEECEFRCRSMCGLDKHYQVAHGQGWSRTYECHCCRKQFPLGARLTKHLMKQHDFHWPSGHSRFRYKEDADGVFRLQTVRYESIEVTQEIIRTNTSETTANNSTNVQESENESAPKYVLLFAENGQKNVVCPTANTIVISISDIDERGNVLNSQEVKSNEMKVLTQTAGDKL